MNVEIMAWSSLIAGLSTFIGVKALSWMPMSVRLMIWFLGASLMGFALVYLVAAYDPRMTRQATVVASWIMLSTRIAIPLLAVYVVFKWGNTGVKAMAIAALFSTACLTRIDDRVGYTCIAMGMLIGVFVWLAAEAMAMIAGLKESACAKKDDNRIATG